jgi:hypothetical protein
MNNRDGLEDVGGEFGEEGEEGSAVGELFDGAGCGDVRSDVRVEPREHCGQCRVLAGNLLHISNVIITFKTPRSNIDVFCFSR